MGVPTYSPIEMLVRGQIFNTPKIECLKIATPKKLMDQIFIHPRNSVSETIFFICHGLDKDSRKYYDAVVFRCYNLFLYSREFCVFQ